MNYDFQRELLTVHEANIRNFDRKIKADEFSLGDGIRILISANASEVIAIAADDFADFLSVSMDSQKFSLKIIVHFCSPFDFARFSISSSPKAKAKVFSSANRGGAILLIDALVTFDKIPPTISVICSCV